MARFDVYANPEAAERGLTPYLVDVQNDYIDGLATRVVVPLRPARAFGARAERLHPLVQVHGEDMVLDTAAMGAVPRSELRTPIGSLKAFQADIQSALDALFGAY